jgi:Cdc6-like AAA superfamily ATPase
MQWLSPTDFPSQQYDIISQRQEGTGQWFLDSTEFKSWLEGYDKTLFCPGIPGAGKTMMAAIAIDRLCQIAPSENIGVAYIYCNYKSQSHQSENALLAAILKQLVQSRPSIAEPVLQLYNIHSIESTRPSLNEFFAVLQSVCTKYSRVHIVVDALDECTNQDGERDRLIAKLRELQHGSDIHLMVTARFVPDIEQQFRSASKLEVRASNEDVRLYIAGQMYRLPKCIQYDEEMKNLVQRKLVIAVDGM